MTAVYAIIFDPNGYRKLIGNKVYRCEADAKAELNPEVCLNEYAVIPLEVDE